MDLINVFRRLVVLFPLCLGFHCTAQEVTVRVINAANGRPLGKQAVSVSFLYDKKYDKEIPAEYDPILSLETAANGEACFRLPEPPPTHFSAQVRIDWSHWHCRCGAMGSTDDLVHKGIVETVATAKSGVPIKAAPGEILFVVTPLSFFERLLYPFTKE